MEHLLHVPRVVAIAMRPVQPLDDEALAQHLRDSRQLRGAADAAVKRAIAIFDRPARAAAPTGPLRRFIAAVLDFDSLAPGAALAGVRATSGSQRHLLFRLEQHDVELRVRRSAAAGASGYSISGQVVGPDEPGEVQLRCGPFQARLAWSAQGEFRFEPVPDGECELRLEAQTWQSTLPAITLPATPLAGDG